MAGGGHRAQGEAGMLLQVGSNQKISGDLSRDCVKKSFLDSGSKLFSSQSNRHGVWRGVLFKSCLAPIAEFFSADCWIS